MMKSFYDKLIEAGCEPMQAHSNSSDLHVPVTPETTALVRDYQFKRNVTVFTSNLDGEQWYDVPFAWEPFWDDAEEEVGTWVGGYHPLAGPQP